MHIFRHKKTMLFPWVVFSPRFDESSESPSPSDQFDALSYKEKKPFQELAALARYDRFVQEYEEKLT